MAKFYDIKAMADGSPVINIYGDIGFDWWAEESNDAKTFATAISDISSDAITVRVNSFGGSVSDGLAIYNAIKSHPANVTIQVDGVAYSIASLIAMAGDEVVMAENTLLMIHAPWGSTAGNAKELRDYADVLDTYAEAMATSYMSKSGKPREEIEALLKDGADHYYTADEALAEGFIDSVSDAVQIAASSLKVDRYSPPAAWVAANHQSEDKPMAVVKKTAAPEVKVAEDKVVEPVAKVTESTTPSEAEIMAKEKTRRTEIRAAVTPFKDREGVQSLLDAMLDDHMVTASSANEKILAHLGAESEPLAGVTDIRMGESDKEKFVRGASKAILARAGVEKREEGNEFRGMTLVDIARASLDKAGIQSRGMDKMEVVGAAFTQSGSDFPILLENVMHKTLLNAYSLAADTWSRFCATGEVSDFRAHNRYRIGSFGNLDGLNELGEFKNKSIPDGEKETITASTKGNIINISRQAIINDDLGAFNGLAAMLGRSAKRTIEADVYALLASNPVMSDGTALFHADHGNLAGSGAAPTVATVEAMRVAMASQMDVSGNDFLDLRPAVWVGGMGTGGTAREINGAEYNDDSQKNQRKPNIVRGLFGDVVDSPRIAGNEWYGFASPMDAPVVEVAFLDGVQEPYLESVNGFTVDGAQMKVRLDYAVDAIDYRGAYKNAGA